VHSVVHFDGETLAPHPPSTFRKKIPSAEGGRDVNVDAGYKAYVRKVCNLIRHTFMYNSIWRRVCALHCVASSSFHFCQ